MPTAMVGIERGIQLVDPHSGAVREQPPVGSAEPRPGWASARTARPWFRPASTGRVALWDAGRRLSAGPCAAAARAVQQPAFGPDGECTRGAATGTAIAWDIGGERGLGAAARFTRGDCGSPSGFDGHPRELQPRRTVDGARVSGTRASGSGTRGTWPRTARRSARPEARCGRSTSLGRAGGRSPP